MAIVKNQFGTFETDKLIGGKRLPVTAEQESIAQRLYGKSFKDLTNTQRVNIRKGKFIDDTITFEQYLEDYKGMASDPNYKPKYIKPNLGTGMSPQQIRARAEAKKTIEGFESKFSKNVSRRKRLKLKEALAADPQRRQIEMAKKAERRRGRRVAKLADKKSLSPNERLLNFEQSLITRQLNDKIKANPNIILKNEKLIDQLSTTVDRDGNIIKSKPTIYELETRGLFEIEHQRDVRKTGAMKDFPYNRNLILGPHNRAGGFKDMAEKFIEKNPDPNNPKVKNIIKKAEELKITLQPEVPKGTFKTKGLGFKQPADATGKFVEYAKFNLPELVDDKIGLKGFTGDTKMLETGLGLKQGTILSKLGGKGKLAAATLAGLGIGTAAVADEELPVKYNDEIGAFVDPKTDDKVSQATLLDWAANNPMPTAAVASAPLLSKTVRKGAGKLLKGLLSTLGSSAAGLTFAGATVKGNLEEGKNIVDATVDPMVGIELLYPEAAKRFGGKGLQNALGRALSLGRVGAMMTPVGIGITALGLGKMGIEAAMDEREKILGMTEEEKTNYLADQYESFGGVFGEGA